MVANVTVNSNADAETKILSRISELPLASLNNVKTGAYALMLYKIMQLRRNRYGYVFQEIRIACFKPKIGRKLSVVLMGQLVQNLVPRKRDETISVRGTDYRALPDNTASLPEVASLEKAPNAAIYVLPIHFGSYHVRIEEATQMDCDSDMSEDSDPDATGNWQFYVR